MFSKGVEEAIRDAIERGEFDQLPGAGKPINLDAYFETPEELRLAHSMLRNAGLLPEGVELLQQIGSLQELARLASSEEDRQSAARRLRDTQLKFGVLMDSMKRHGRAR